MPLLPLAALLACNDYNGDCPGRTHKCGWYLDDPDSCADLRQTPLEAEYQITGAARTYALRDPRDGACVILTTDLYDLSPMEAPEPWCTVELLAANGVCEKWQ